MKRCLNLESMLLLSCLITGACTDVHSELDASLQKLGETISKGVGTVREMDAGLSPPVVILDEHHNSRIGQIEHAVMMVRLYEDYKMRDIALEAYLETDPEIDTKWFTLASGGDKSRKLLVAARLLAEGEISASEFMALIYPDVHIHRTEKESEYNVRLPESAMNAPQLYLFRLADARGGKVSTERIRSLEAASETLDTLQSAGASQEALKSARNSVVDAQKAAYRELVSIDPWIAGEYEWFDKFALKSLDETLKHANEIQARAEESNAVDDVAERQAMQQYITFYSGRASASATMAGAAINAVNPATGHVIAMEIGQGHTADVVARFREMDRGFVSIRPLATSDPANLRTDISFDLYQRKEEGESLYSNGFMAELVGAVGTKKPQPVLWQAWLQAKAELYLVIEEVTQAILASGDDGLGGPPTGPTAAPYGIPDNNDDRRWIGLDPKRVLIVPDGDDGEYYYLSSAALGQLKSEDLAADILAQLERHSGEMTRSRETAIGWLGADADPALSERVVEATRVSGTPAVFFPVVLNYRAPEKSRELWVKAALSRDSVSSSEREDAEAILLRELEAARESAGISRDRVEDETGRVRVSLETLASLGTSGEDVRQRALGEV